MMYPFKYLHGRWQQYSGNASMTTSSVDCSNAVEEHPEPPRTDSEAQSEPPVEESSTPCPSTQISISRTKSSYPLCQPPPPKNRFHAHRRILLQLRKSKAGRRASPFLEVYPEPSLTRRLSKRRPRKHSESGTFNHDNLVVYGCEKYNLNHSHAGDNGDSAEDEALDQRETVARIRQSSMSKSDLQMRATISIREEDWVASVLPKGGYEFACTDAHGVTTKVRWLPKVTKRRMSTSLQTQSGMENQRETQVCTSESSQSTTSGRRLHGQSESRHCRSICDPR